MKSYKMLTIISITCASLALAFYGITNACTSFIAGKNVTADGSVIAAHNEDLSADTCQRVEVFPGKKFNKHEVEYLESGPALWWIPEKYKVIQFNSGYDPTDYNGDNPNFLNEFGVTCWDNAMTPRDELREIESTAVNLVASKELKRIPLERAKTAREAVLLLGYLVDTYGFQSTGMAYGIADPNEGWVVEVTKGKHWVAQRVPDNMVVMRSNCYRIQVVDLTDTANFLGSADLISYAVDQGWYDSSSGPFNFAETYGSPSSMNAASNTLREWGGLNFLKPSLALDPAGPWPYIGPGGVGDGVIPDAPITVKNSMSFLRNHYEGTAMDATNGYENGSPHWTNNRVICVTTTNSSSVVQLRPWLPPDIGHVIWRADNTPCASVYVPWYLGITDTPVEFRTGTSEPSDDSAWWIYTRIANTTDPHYKDFIENVRPVFEEMENDLLSNQHNVEIIALGKNPQQAAKYLTEYSSDAALNALDTAKQILNDLVHDTAVGRWKNPEVCP